MALITQEILLGFHPSVTRGPGMVERESELSPGERVEVPIEVTTLSFTDGNHTIVVPMDETQVRVLVETLSGVVLP